jgi:ribosomal protein RSM22 (predicted rRNA methylase)
VRRHDFAPASLLDAGAGPGTASWAAAGIWPSLGSFAFLDSNADFLSLAAELASNAPGALSKARRWHLPIEQIGQDMGADLVVAAYALAEVPKHSLPEAAERLWRAAGSVLAVVEPGTPEGFRRVRGVREALVAMGAVPVAPCTHADACPVTGGDWCHFSVRLARSRAHMHAKGASVPFEDEKFSYVILARDGGAAGGGRILSPPLHGKPGSSFRLCAQGRIETLRIARRDAAAYKRIRKLEWGDRIGPLGEDGT